MQALKSGVQNGGLVFLATFNDDLYRLHLADALDKSLIASRFEVIDVIEIASERLAHWRDYFTRVAQERWAKKGECGYPNAFLRRRLRLTGYG